MSDLEPIDVALRVAAAIVGVGGTYFVGGSLASSLQGEPRATNDIDIVLNIPLGRIQTFVDQLGSDFEVDVDMLRQALLTGSCCNIFYLPTVLKIDLFAQGDRPFDELEFVRRRSVKVRADGAELVVKSVEDTVLRKLMWFDQGGRVSDRQWRDVVSVLRANVGGLDNTYLTRWAKTIGMADLLDKALQEAAR